MFGIGEQTESTVLFIKVFHSKVNVRGLIRLLLFLVFNSIRHEQRVNFVPMNKRICWIYIQHADENES